MNATQLALFPLDEPQQKRDKILDLVTQLRIRDIPELPIVVSYGGGINSTAMLIAARMKRIIPAHIIFADTGNEKPQTYEFLEWFDNWLRSPWYDYPVFPGITVVRNQPKKAGKREKIKKQFRFEGKVSFLAAPWLAFEQIVKQTFVPANLGEHCLTLETLPSKAYGYGACSARWKIDPIEECLSELKLDSLIQWIGIHAGETSRLLTRTGEPKELTHRFGYMDYPLIKWGLAQEHCEALCRFALGFIPSKSACWFCPHARPTEVLSLKHSNPELYEIACFMEDQAMRHSPPESSVKGLGRKFSWRDIETMPEAQRIQTDLFLATQKCACTD